MKGNRQISLQRRRGHRLGSLLAATPHLISSILLNEVYFFLAHS